MFNSRKAEAKYLTLIHKMREEGLEPACANRADLFFPDGYDNIVRMQIQEARNICAQCPLVNECYSYALEAREEYGIWAGTTPDDRRELLRAKLINRGI